jgi:adenosylcobinamide-GDP ribazoletransferase
MMVEKRSTVARAPGTAGWIATVATTVTAAVAMLTRMPVRAHRDATGAAAFAVVGAVLGLVAAIPLLALGGLVPTLAAILAVAVLAVVTGGIHLDGLADTADALLAPDPVRAEAARKDPAIGSGGAVALILVLGGEVAALSAIGASGGPVLAGLACVGAGAASRTLPIVVAWTAARAGQTGGAGLGGWFAGRIGRADVAIGLLTTTAVTIAVGAIGGTAALPAAVAIGSAVGLLLSAGLVRARSGIDGDLLGASVELGFVAILGTMAVAAELAWPAR